MASEKKKAASKTADERRRSLRVRLTGAALINRQMEKGSAITAVLDNVNRVGAGLHAKQHLKANELVTVSLAFLDQNGDEQQEKLAGKVAWTRTWEKGYLIGVVWEHLVTKERNRWLYMYLNETLKETA